MSRWVVDFMAAIANVIFLLAWESKHVNAWYHNTCTASKHGIVRSSWYVSLSYSSGWRADVSVVLSEKSVIFKAEMHDSIFAERVYRSPLICRVAFEHREKFTNARYHRTSDQSEIYGDLSGKFSFPEKRKTRRYCQDTWSNNNFKSMVFCDEK